jgi:hypothetical protein
MGVQPSRLPGGVALGVRLVLASRDMRYGHNGCGKAIRTVPAAVSVLKITMEF